MKWTAAFVYTVLIQCSLQNLLLYLGYLRLMGYLLIAIKYLIQILTKMFTSTTFSATSSLMAKGHSGLIDMWQEEVIIKCCYGLLFTAGQTLIQTNPQIIAAAQCQEFQVQTNWKQK